ncbi:MAG: hypothetical protein WCC64_03095 [Aliidongia sp.]
MKTLKLTVDIISVFSISVPFGFVIYQLIYGEFETRHNGKFNETVVIMLLSFIPATFAMFWLVFRYDNQILWKNPFIATVKFRIILSIGSILAVFVVKYFWR